MVVTDMKHYEKERYFKDTTKRTNHEKDIPKSNLKSETQGHKTRTQNMFKNDRNEILLR
jgi:hypothetical protein